jgi:cobalamin biosynthesis Mg chelatase CobN
VSELEGQIRTLAAGALSLAVARYLHDNRKARKKASGAWLDAEAEDWSERSPEEIAAEATHRLDVLEQWVEDAQQEDPELYESRRLDSVHARMNLQSARSGAFGTAAGPLADFLREVGAKPETLELG